MPKTKTLFLAFIAIILLWGGAVNAGPLDPKYDEDIKKTPVVIPQDNDIITEIRRIFYDNLLPIFKYIFASAAVLIWVIYVVLLITAAGNEETISQQKKNLAWGVGGFILISLAITLGDVFTPVGNAQNIIQIPEAQKQLQKIIGFMQMSITIISIITIFYAGVNFVRSRGEEEDITESKKYLQWGALGIVVAMLSEPIIMKVFYPAPDAILGQDQIANFAEETGGVFRFFLSFLGVVAFVTLIIAGFYYVTSFGDDERQEKAKNIITGTIIGIILILSAYTLVNVFAPTA